MKTAVIPTRNDNYGLFLAERSIQCINSMTSVFDEVILVDWNSPHDLPLFSQIKEHLIQTKKIRSIVIPKAFVQSHFFDPNIQPCCEVLARNIGIRRAKHDWIVSTNIDVIPSQFDEGRLDPSTLYAVAKYNVPDQVHLTQLICLKDEHKIQVLKQNKHNMERMKRCYAYRDYYGNDVPWERFSICVGTGDFQIGHRNVWSSIRGFEEKMLYRCYSDGNVMVKAANFDGLKTSELDIDVFHLDHKNNPYFWKKDQSTHRNNIEDAFVKYKVTQNTQDWGLKGVEFEEEIY